MIAGPLEVEEEHYLAELDPADMVRHVGHLPRESLMALERRADALLLVTAPKLFSLATGKLFEYLAAGAPIIALAQGNDASGSSRRPGPASRCRSTTRRAGRRA